MSKTIENDSMETSPSTVSPRLNFAQIAWVVKDVETAKTFFQQMLGVNNFSKTTTTRLAAYDGTYYGGPSNAENLVAMAY